MTAPVASDPLALLGLVLDRTVSQLAPDDEDGARADAPAEVVLAMALGDRLARALCGDEWQPHFEALVERVSMLAGALGACDCWGEDPSCPVCQGAGRAGWALPDERLYAAYVQPAVGVMASATPETSPNPDERATGA